jgi:hypothetical protein
LIWRVNTDLSKLDEALGSNFTITRNNPISLPNAFSGDRECRADIGARKQLTYVYLALHKEKAVTIFTS